MIITHFLNYQGAKWPVINYYIYYKLFNVPPREIRIWIVKVSLVY
jgi:hypothetical protein